MAVERILIVDDEPGVRTALEDILGDEGFHVESAASGEAGLERLADASFDAVLLDVWLPGVDGLETLQKIRERNFDPAVVMISGHGTIETAVRATKLGAFDFVEKPLSLERTLLVLRNALRQRRLQRMNLRLLEQLSRDTEITGSSPAAIGLRQRVEIAAESDSPVLISGPHGSGRETIARRIHATGRHPDGPFVEVPTAALDAESVTSVLFGGAQGAGRIELAAGGSLFLEDLDRLPEQHQQRLAALLEERTRREPGLRLLASVSSSQLHRELADLLDVIRIEVPPLRQRSADIPPLAERFMQDVAREYAREPKRLSAEALQTMMAWEWPGNIRELQNLMERLLLFVEADEIVAADLPAAISGRPPLADLYGAFESLAQGVEAFQRFHLLRAVQDAGGDVPAAARRLRLGEEDCRRLLQRYGQG